MISPDDDLAPGSTKSFEEFSYAAHSKEYADHRVDGRLSELAQSWLRTDTVQAEIQHSLRLSVVPLLAAFPGSKWLTVGDGGLGNDAHFLMKYGVDAVATDISTELLAEAKRSGHIRDYAWQNAEKLSYPDDSFDFVLCKEAYHHFPGPILLSTKCSAWHDTVRC